MTDLAHPNYVGTTHPLPLQVGGPHFAITPAVYLYDWENTLQYQVSSILEGFNFPIRTLEGSFKESFLSDQTYRGVMLLHHDGSVRIESTFCRPTAEYYQIPRIWIVNGATVADAVRLMRLGAWSVLQTPLDGELVINAVRSAMQYDIVAFPQWQERQYQREKIRNLTEKESLVLKLMLKGLPNKVIARRLSVSQRTIELRRQMIYNKTNTRGLAQLIRLALDTGLDFDAWQEPDAEAI